VLEVGASLGAAGRLDDPATYAAEDRAGVVLGAGAGLFVSPHVAFGLGYEHLGLGSEDSGVTPFGTVSISHALDSVWADVRLYPFVDDVAGGYLRLGVAAAFQSAELTGLAWPLEAPARAVELSCSAGPSPGLGLRIEAGGDFALSECVHLTAGAGVDLYRLGDEVIGGCAPGAGSAVVLGGRAGFVYRWPL
jgi:hypothetical protein